MVKCIIVDDEPLACQLIESYIRRLPELQLITSCVNALEAFSIINKEKIDLIFLDVQMPGLTGTGFINSLKNPPAFIFITAHPEHAVLSYELDALDYLLKPVTFERFEISISRFFKTYHDLPAPVEYTYFKVNGKMVKLMHKDILYAQSFKDYIIIKTINGKYMTHMTMKYLAELLSEKILKRVHRSFLVGVSHIKTISRTEIEIDSVQIPIGESYKEDVSRMNK